MLWRKGSYGVCSHRGELFRQRIVPLVEMAKRLGGVVPKSGRSSSSLHRKNGITPYPPGCVRQAPASERLRGLGFTQQG